MRSYAQYCGLARALDVIGERWSLLLVRELLDGPRRYNELLAGLPGVATNLLAERLRSLEAGGVIARRDDARYALTPWGQGLHEVVYALGRWAGPLMAQPRGGDAFQSSWLRHMVIARFEGHDPLRRDLSVELRCDGADPMTLVAAGGRVHIATRAASTPDVTLAGPPEPVVGLLLGRITRAQAEARGVRARGDVRRLTGLRPRGERQAATLSRA
ncbi:MAG: helix-turn-helix transcriptional regulator [Candidatus Dormibacteraeota bacterium]|nr:helix-turn-helix transcriptional regulator [Candidatus Dormibacteraeota bacterium]MBV9526425.1 helix-turn-helix transcriptional regulator [Candidatus Dormibacteraeota bacterium]